MLRTWYAISLKRDPNYSGYLDKIGRIWFGIQVKPAVRSRNSMFGGLIKSIIGEDSSDEERGTTSAPSTFELD